MVHGGAGGIREESLLASAMARPRQQLAYAAKPDLIAMAAACTAGIIKNHPFFDGNERVGFVVVVPFLELNGCDFVATEDRAARAVIDLATGALDEPGHAKFL